MFDITALPVPIVQAPMAGGPSTPALAAAVSNAGGLGFLAAGYKSALSMGGEIAATRDLTTLPFGVNVFVPQPSAATEGEIARYRAELEPVAKLYGVAVGATRDDDDDWAGKVDLLETVRPAVVSFTFGLPSPQIVERLKDAGILLISTVTTVTEARSAAEVGVDLLCVQGFEAGGHRGTFDPRAQPSTETLDHLVTAIRDEIGLPLIAAGGLASRNDVARVLGLGAAAAQAGTAFLRCDEAGTKQAHRDAFVSHAAAGTSVTRAFSGRFARGILNKFMADHDGSAPFGYPEIHQMTTPIRAAANAIGDADGLNLWAGTGYRSTRDGSAASIVSSLTP